MLLNDALPGISRAHDGSPEFLAPGWRNLSYACCSHVRAPRLIRSDARRRPDVAGDTPRTTEGSRDVAHPRRANEARFDRAVPTTDQVGSLAQGTRHARHRSSFLRQTECDPVCGGFRASDHRQCCSLAGDSKSCPAVTTRRIRSPPTRSAAARPGGHTAPNSRSPGRVVQRECTHRQRCVDRPGREDPWRGHDRRRRGYSRVFGRDQCVRPTRSPRAFPPESVRRDSRRRSSSASYESAGGIGGAPSILDRSERSDERRSRRFHAKVRSGAARPRA